MRNMENEVKKTNEDEQNKLEKEKILNELFECEVVDTAFTCHEPRHIK